MSERMTNLEIEDVLSSIRRLVSQDAKPVEGAVAAVPRLVLTPALRVPAPAAKAEPVAALDSRVQGIETLLSQSVAEFEPDLAEDLAPDSSFAWPQVDEAPFIDADTPEDPRTAEAGPVSRIDPAKDTPEATVALQPDWSKSDADPETDGDAPALLDEATLREIVRDILREELAGPMGTRVTRNLRRLIRSEIARTLVETQRG
jgi:hypothetical protein